MQTAYPNLVERFLAVKATKPKKKASSRKTQDDAVRIVKTTTTSAVPKPRKRKQDPKPVTPILINRFLQRISSRRKPAAPAKYVASPKIATSAAPMDLSMFSFSLDDSSWSKVDDDDADLSSVINGMVAQRPDVMEFGGRRLRFEAVSPLGGNVRKCKGTLNMCTQSNNQKKSENRSYTNVLKKSFSESSVSNVQNNLPNRLIPATPNESLDEFDRLVMGPSVPSTSSSNQSRLVMGTAAPPTSTSNPSQLVMGTSSAPSTSTSNHSRLVIGTPSTSTSNPSRLVLGTGSAHSTSTSNQYRLAMETSAPSTSTSNPSGLVMVTSAPSTSISNPSRFVMGSSAPSTSTSGHSSTPIGHKLKSKPCTLSPILAPQFALSPQDLLTTSTATGPSPSPIESQPESVEPQVSHFFALNLTAEMDQFERSIDYRNMPDEHPPPDNRMMRRGLCLAQRLSGGTSPQNATSQDSFGLSGGYIPISKKLRKQFSK